MTPPGLAPGAPAGSYALTGFENVNLYSGNLNLTLPLVKVGGRGRAGAAVNLSIDSVKWDMIFTARTSTNTTQLPLRPGGIDEIDYRAFDFGVIRLCTSVTVIDEEGGTSQQRCEVVTNYDDHNPNGAPSMPPMQLPMMPQTTSYAFFPIMRPDWAEWTRPGPGYGPGILQGQYSSAWEQLRYPDPLDPRHDDPQHHLIQSLYRIRFTAPDGTEHELIDTKTGGKPVFHSFAEDVDRGRVFVSTDGSAMTFIADAPLSDDSGDPTGYLFFPDGTRARVAGGLIAWTRDTNGNQVRYTYGTDHLHRPSFRRVTEIVDTLGRRVTITYADTANLGATTSLYDEIKFNGVGGELNRSIKVWRSRLEGALLEGQELKTAGELFPGTSRQSSLPVRKVNPVVASKVELPDGSEYELKYNSYAEVARVKLPTGGAVKYNYADPIVTTRGIHRRVKERLVSPDGANWEEQQLFKAEYGAGVSDGIGGWSTTVTVETRDLKGGDRLVSKAKHYFHGYPLLATAPQLFYPSWLDGREYKTEQLDTAGDATTVLRSEEKVWRQRLTPTWWDSFTRSAYQLHPSNAPARDPRVVTSIDAIEPGGANLVAIQTSVDPSDATGSTVGFDQFNNRTDLWEYDYGTSGQGGPLVRHTHTDYVSSLDINGTTYDYACATDAACGQSASADAVIHIRNLPAVTEVRDGATSAVVSRSVLVYDEPARLGDDYGNLPSEFPGWAAPATPARGNLTTTKLWLNTLGAHGDESAYLQTHADFDRFGNAVRASDASGNISSVEFSPAYHFAFPTRTISPDPDGSGLLTPLTTETVYDFATGLPTNFFDANNKETRAEYADALDRLTKVTRPDGGRTEYRYWNTDPDYDGGIYLRTRTLLDSSPVERVTESYLYFDGLGRKTRAYTKDGTSADRAWVVSKTEYDGVGRTARTWNPLFRSDRNDFSLADFSPSPVHFTTMEYDALNRIKAVTGPDGGVVTTSHVGKEMTVKDQANKARKSVSDALGRLREVYEDPTGLNHKTTYDYSALGNLTKVTQGDAGQAQQTRTFAYDSLSRLVSATNPEMRSQQGVPLPVIYLYDLNGNLRQKTDARGKVITYLYDALDRLTSKQYSDATPWVTYTYDTATDGRGFLASVRSSVSTYSYAAYDAMGRVRASSQTLHHSTPDTSDDITYSMPDYSYDKAGNLVSQTYPSGKIFKSDYDAAGRIAGVRNQSGFYYAGGAPTDPSGADDRIAYAAHGAVSALRLGNGLWEYAHFNSSLQPAEIGLGTSRAASDVLKLEYGYGELAGGVLDQTKNNGNVRSQKISVPATDSVPAQTYTQAYTYDPLNRLKSAEETDGAAVTWRQSYTYDPFGNRRLDESASASGVPATTKPSAQQFQQSRALYNPAISSLSNRISETGYSYDEAGNLLCDPTHACGAAPYFAYDAENRVTSAGGTAAAGGAEYSYDGDGRRVRKVWGAQVTVFVYGASGILIAEYSNQIVGGGVSYLTQDHLGSTRVVTGQGGASEVKGRYDYMPFGEEVEGRQGYTTGSVRQKFTGKERDNETGLDHFQARNYSPLQGRFVNIDPLYFQAEMTSDPQRFNLYSYVRNNPLKFIDPTGKEIEFSANEEQRRKQLNELKAALKGAGAFIYVKEVEYEGWAGSIYKRYFAYIHDIGPDGRCQEFEKFNPIAAEIGAIIRSEKIVTLVTVDPGTKVTNDSGDTMTIDRVKEGVPNQTPAWASVFNGQEKIILMDSTKSHPGTLPAKIMEDGKPGFIYPGEVLAHELGHIRAHWRIGDDHPGNSHPASLRLQNKVRKLHDPKAPERVKH